MNVGLSKDALKVVQRVDAPTRHRIMRGIENIPIGDIQPYKGVEGLYRLRIGGWRILFSYDADSIFIKAIGSRGDIYK